MQDIVEAAGLEKGSIYGHFSSKEELALEAFDFAWGDTVQKRLGNLDSVDLRSISSSCTLATTSIPRAFQGAVLC